MEVYMKQNEPPRGKSARYPLLASEDHKFGDNPPLAESSFLAASSPRQAAGSSRTRNKLFVILGIWFLLSFILPLLHDGLNRDSITRLLILSYFLFSLWWFYKKGQFIEVKNPKRTFIVWCTINAMAVEIFHMISRPLHQSLLITSNTSFLEALKNTSIDLILTFPAYVLIFLVIWQFVKRYHYSPFSFFFLMGLGQALGDGNGFFLINPGALIFIPYVMLNYWAMNFVPYLIVRKDIPSTLSQGGKFGKIISPIFLLPVTYLIAGGIILTIGAVLGWIPK